MMANRRPHDPGCDGTCRWRQLYEGNRISLSDLNDKLRTAVGRHGRLRNNLVSMMRKAFPAQFLEAERREQRRMSDQPDEVLLRYMTLWLTQRPDTGLQTGPGVTALRGALSAAGFVLPPDGDLAAWAKAVGDQQRTRAREQAEAQERDGRDSAAPPVPASPTPTPDAAPQHNELAGLFDPRTPPRPHSPGEPVGPGPVDAEHPSANDDLAMLLWGDEAADGPAAGRSGQGADASDNDRSPAARPAVPSATVEDRDPTDAAPGPDQRTQPEPVDADPIPDGPTPAGPAPSVPARPAANPASGARKGQQSPPLRPQLFPAAKNNSKTRRRRDKAETTASAQSPLPDMDVPQSEQAPGSGPVPTGLHERAVELVKRPQPLFTSDLVALGLGSEEDVAAWEQACRDVDDSPVRFIPPKPRHRQRGGLVIPYTYAKQAPAEFKRTTWAQMLEQYRGARVYELAVVLHRIQDDLMSADLHDSHVVMRLAQPRGLVGLIVTTEADFARGDDARDALTGAIESLFSNHLTLLGVLCTNHNALPKAIKAIEEEARERDWNPSFPIIAQRSWEYAADRGSSATLVLGG